MKQARNLATYVPITCSFARSCSPTQESVHVRSTYLIHIHTYVRPGPSEQRGGHDDGQEPKGRAVAGCRRKCYSVPTEEDTKMLRTPYSADGGDTVILLAGVGLATIMLDAPPPPPPI